MLEPHLHDSINYLNSPTAFKAIETDIYWPKWNTPWWHMMLLWELGKAKSIPSSIAGKLIARMNSSPYVHFFPTSEDQVFEGLDVSRHTFCHCHLGSIYQVLSAMDIDVDIELPWIRPWFLKYQLPDGGLNCENESYSKPSPKSSIISSLPPLEAILYCTNRQFTAEEEAFLDRGANYLLERKLCRRNSEPNQLIDKSFLNLCFPRFYHYDILRGLRFVVDWSVRLNRKLPSTSISEVVGIIDSNSPNGQIFNQRLSYEGEGTLLPTENGVWTRGHKAVVFPLLTETSALATHSEILTNHWLSIKEQLSTTL